MILRELCAQDQKPMLEWMHDKDVVSDLKGNFLDKTLQDCAAFIENSRNDPQNLHFAIADDHNHYMGTVSLKHIHPDWAEFAIVVGKAAMGTGISKAAMKEMLDYGITQLGLAKIYWCVSKENTRAVRFYDKNGYVKSEEIPTELKAAYKQEGDALLWYYYKG